MFTPEATDAVDFGGLIRQLLHRRELAAARHRAAVGRAINVNDREILLIAYLAQRGAMAPAEVGSLLNLSSAGVTAMVQRLEDAGHLVRAEHPGDRRSILISLSPRVVEHAERAFRPLVGELQALAEEIPPDDRIVIARFLERVVVASEEHAERAANSAGKQASTSALPSPGLWA
jgi:DNA-binding MarR family transcriptional regulator